MKWLTTEDVAEMMQVDVATVRRWCRRGDLKSVRLPGGTMRRIAPGAVDEMLGISAAVIELRPPNRRRTSGSPS